MRYLCLIHLDHDAFARLSGAQCASLASECLAYRDDLQRGGQLIAAGFLQPLRAATSLRLRGADPCLDAGPCLPARDPLCGFYLIEAADLNDAIRLTAHAPSARHGCIEIRAVHGAALPLPAL